MISISLVPKLFLLSVLILLIQSSVLLVQGERRGSTTRGNYIQLGRWSLPARNDRGSKCSPLDLSTWGEAIAVREDTNNLPPKSYPDDSDAALLVVKTKKSKRRKKHLRPETTTTTTTSEEGEVPAASSSTSQQDDESTTSAGPSLLDKASILKGITQPLIPQNVWDQLAGDEFEDPKVIDNLAQTGLKMAKEHENNGWIQWKDKLPSNIDAALDNGETFVCTGSALRPGFGSEVPWIKSMSVLPMSPSELNELMMDSSRVQTYNSLSLGRKDLRIIPTNNNNGDNNQQQQQQTKIVRNVVQLPVANKKVESVTLLHSRKLNDGSHLLISRAVGGNKYATDGKIARSYILLGVNLFEPIHNSPDECRMTAITHVYQPGVPLMIAGKVGVKSAKNFIKDIRALCVPAL